MNDWIYWQIFTTDWKVHWVTITFQWVTVNFQLQLLIPWNWNETIMIITKLNTLPVRHTYSVLTAAVLKCNPLKPQGLVVQSRIKKNSGFARNSILSWTLTNIALKILLPSSWCLETEWTVVEKLTEKWFGIKETGTWIKIQDPRLVVKWAFWITEPRIPLNPVWRPWSDLPVRRKHHIH